MLLFTLGTVFYLLYRICLSYPSSHRRTNVAGHKTYCEATFIFLSSFFRLHTTEYRSFTMLMEVKLGVTWRHLIRPIQCWMNAPMTQLPSSLASIRDHCSHIIVLCTFVTFAQCWYTAAELVDSEHQWEHEVAKLTQEGGPSLLLMVVGLLYSLYTVVLLIIGLISGNGSQDYSFKFLVGLAIFEALVGLILPSHLWSTYVHSRMKLARLWNMAGLLQSLCGNKGRKCELNNRYKWPEVIFKVTICYCPQHNLLSLPARV